MAKSRKVTPKEDDQKSSLPIVQEVLTQESTVVEETPTIEEVLKEFVPVTKEETPFDQSKELTEQKIAGAKEEALDLENPKCAFVNLSDKNNTPVYGQKGSPLMPIQADIRREFLRIASGNSAYIQTGIHAEIPMGFVLEVRTDSTIAAGKGLVVLDSPRLIDSNDRSEIVILIHNVSKHDRIIYHGEVIANLFLAMSPRPAFEVLDSLKDLTPEIKPKNLFTEEF